ncbi:S8 family serine peptidase [Kitasatospora sp. NPDC002227]|uniref:S8 family serine peptidase n=1 Tax=Kitasatospora sp. NPDC002227 TaxID=3154773 RepID=UPI00332F046F
MTLTRFVRALGATALVGGLLVAGVPAASADQVRDAQWVINYFHMEQVWQISKGDGVIVAVIDSGVNGTQADLAGSVLPGYDPSGQGLDSHPTDRHGTTMAGHIVGHGHGDGAGVVGLAPGAKVLPIYKSTAANTDAVPEDIHWAVEHGAKVINMSVGGTMSNPRIGDALSYAAQHDVLVVASTGNSGTSLESPAREPGLLAVGATDKNNVIWRNSNFGPQVMLAAPGVGIVGVGPCDGSQYCMADGTSDSTAFVSATAALVRAKFPNLTAGQVANRLVKSALVPASLKGAKLPDAHYGYGIVRPYEALTMDIPAGSAQGPLAKPSGAAADSPSAAATPGGAVPSGPTSSNPVPPSSVATDSKTSGLMIGAGIGLAVLVVLVIVILVVARRKKTPPPAPPMPYGGQPGWQPQQPQYPGQYQQPYPNQQYGNQPPPQGYPPQQPYQNPYGQSGNDQR